MVVNKHPLTEILGAPDMFLQSYEKELTDKGNLTDRSGWWKDTIKVGEILSSCSLLVPLDEEARPNSGERACLTMQQHQPLCCLLTDIHTCDS